MLIQGPKLSESMNVKMTMISFSVQNFIAVTAKKGGIIMCLSAMTVSHATIQLINSTTNTNPRNDFALKEDIKADKHNNNTCFSLPLNFYHHDYRKKRTVVLNAV